jgi:carboxypeptidase C (cathepsin A)
MVTLKKPEMPQFQDNIEDEPITDIEEQIKEMTTRRNYDLRTIETNNVSKTVSFENEKQEEKEKSVTVDTINFFNNLETFEEPTLDSYRYNNVDASITNDNTDTSIYSLKKQMDQMQDKINSLESKINILFKE